MHGVATSQKYLLVFLLSFALRPSAHASQNLTLNWDRSIDANIAQYNLYYGEVGGATTNKIVAGNMTSATVTDLAAGKSYFFYGTSVNTEGEESKPSNLVNYTASSGPKFSPVANQTAAEGTTILVQLAATIGNSGAVLRYSLSSGPAGAAVDPATGLFRWTPSEAHGPGTYSVTVQVSDNGSPALTDSTSFTIAVTEVNGPPVLAPIPDQSLVRGSTLTLRLMATDSDLPANKLTYSIVSGPSGTVVDPTGLLSWTPSLTQLLGPATVTVRVSDGLAADTKSFTVTVLGLNTPPVLALVPNQTTAEGSTLSLRLTATDVDFPANVLTYSLVSGPVGAVVDPVSGAFTWTPSEVQGPSSNSVTVQVSDGVASDRRTFTITVTEVNSPPLLASIPNQTLDEGSKLVLQLSGSDSDVPANKLTYSLVSGPDGATVDSATGILSWTPSETQGPSSNMVTVQVSDGAASARATFSITVNEVNTPPSLAPVPPQTVAEGAVVTVKLAAVDGDFPANKLTYRLVSGPAGAAVDPLTGVFAWTPTEAQGPSSNSITIQVTDGALTDSKTFSVSVLEVNSAPVLAPIADQRINAGQTLMLTLAASDSDLPANRLTYQLVSGPTAASVDPATGIFVWRLGKTEPSGVIVVTVAVIDNASPSASDTKSFKITVNGKGTRNPQAAAAAAKANMPVLQWAVDLEGGRSLTFAHPLTASESASGSAFVLEASSDLIHWTRVSEITPTSDVRDVAGDAPFRFYRVAGSGTGPVGAPRD